MGEISRHRAPAGAPERLVADLRPPEPADDIRERVAALIADVRAEGDAALVAQTRRFDDPDFASAQIRVPTEVIAREADALERPLATAIATAARQVRAVAKAARAEDREVALEPGQRVELRQVPVGAAGCYVPGGRAAYPSSLIMAAVPAQVAGVGRVAVASPPGPGGLPSPVILGAAGVLGIDEVYALGGTAAVAAMALGTESVRRVNVVVGPGNAWVQEAKRQLVGVVGIDGIAGPSEVVIIADTSADPRVVAADLLAQAEHGPDSPAILLSDDEAVLDAVQRDLAGADLADGPISLVLCAHLDDALALAEAFAPGAPANQHGRCRYPFGGDHRRGSRLRRTRRWDRLRRLRRRLQPHLADRRGRAIRVGPRAGDVSTEDVRRGHEPRSDRDAHAPPGGSGRGRGFPPAPGLGGDPHGGLLMSRVAEITRTTGETDVLRSSRPRWLGDL